MTGAVIDTARREQANEEKSGVGDKEAKDNSGFVDRDGLQKDEKRCERCLWKDGSRGGDSWHDGTYNWREHDVEQRVTKRPFETIVQDMKPVACGGVGIRSPDAKTRVG